MPKRDHVESSGSSSPVMEPSKRHKIEANLDDPIATLLEHSDELISLIKSLKSSGTSSKHSTDTPLRVQLADLSKRILPSIKALAGEAGAGTHGPANVDSITALSQVSFTKWTSADIPKSIPPLPKIEDTAIEQSALTHGACTSGNPTEAYRRCYDRLEWLGDAYLEMFATCFIFDTFPDLPHGKCTQLREMLIRNESLAQWTIEYRLDQRATLPPNFYNSPSGANELKTFKQFRTKVRGDLFEAYVGAVIVSDPTNGITRASSWLKTLWAKTVGHHILKEEQRQQALSRTTACAAKGDGTVELQSNKPPKEQLAHALVIKGVTLRYEDLPQPKKADRDNNLPLFSVGVYLDGWGVKDLMLGRGTGISKREAGTNAALRALENKKLMKKYGDMKQAFLAGK